MATRSAAEVERLLHSIAAEQWGLISFAQLIAAGLSSSSITHRIKAGRIERVLTRVYKLPGAPYSWEQQLMAAHLWAGDHSAVCGPPAAASWGLGAIPKVGVEVALVGERRSRGLPFQVHRVDEHLLPEIETIGRLAVTSVRRTVLDLAARKHPRTSRALDDALFRELTTLPQMWLYHDQEWMRGRRGIRILRQLLVPRTPDKAPTQSDLEDLFRAIVRDFKLPRPKHQHPVDLFGKRVRLDFAYPEARLGIECDFRTWHLNHDDVFETDRDRDNKLRLLGWTILHFTWAMLKFDQEYVAEMVREHLRLAG